MDNLRTPGQQANPASAYGYVNGMDLASDNYSPSVVSAYNGGEAWAADVTMRRQASDPLGLMAAASDSASVLRRAQALWGPMPAQADGGDLSGTATNAERLAQKLLQAGYDGELMPTGGSVRVTPGNGLRPAMVNGVSVNQRTDAALQAAGDLLGMGEMYRDYKLLGGLMSDAQQTATINKLQGALQDKLGMMRVLPTPEALGATPSIGADGSIRYNNADLIDRYGDALRKTEMWKQGIIELDTRNMLITSIGTNKIGPDQWVAENTRRYQGGLAVGMEEGKRRYDAGTLRYPADMPGQLQIGSFADDAARTAVIRYNQSIGVPEGPGQLLSMNRWSYDPSGSGQYNRIDLLLDLGPNRDNGTLILRTALEGKSSLDAVQSSGGQLQRVYNWVTPRVITVTPQGATPWMPAPPKRLR